MVEAADIGTREELRVALQILVRRTRLSYDVLAERTGVSKGTLHDLVSGRTDLPRWGTLARVLTACGVVDAELPAWQRAHGRAKTVVPGVPLSKVTDPFELEVHRPISLGVADETASLPPYVRRKHDDKLADVVMRAAVGNSAMAVLVAGSSAGKTRALWESLRPLRDAGGWRLWHPLDPTRRGAVDTLTEVRPRTVVWLNETQKYLGNGTDTGDEEAATQLRRILADSARAPVLILGTLWPVHHNNLCRDPASQVRKLLDGNVISVPECFTGADLEAVRQAAGADRRLALAFSRAEDGEITQYLAGGPELIERYRFSSSPAAKATIEVAMDLRRMGYRNAVPLEFFRDATPMYISDANWDGLEDDWLEQALAEAGRSCKGAQGPVTRIRTCPRRLSADSRVPPDRVREPSTDSGPQYQLADYLDQYGRIQRAEQIPPVGFWEVVARHALPRDLARLGDAAWNRGLRIDAARLWKEATLHGDGRAAAALIEHIQPILPEDHRPAIWAAEHVKLENPSHVEWVLTALTNADAHTAITTLLSRNPAERVSLDRAWSVAQLLNTLREMGADGPLATLLSRNPAEHADLQDPTAVRSLLRALQGVGADTEIAALLLRNPAVEVRLDESLPAAYLLETLREVGADAQFDMLADRIADHTPIADPDAVAATVSNLRWAGAGTALAKLLARNPAEHIPLANTVDVADVLESCRGGGAADALVAVLLSRNPAEHADLHDPGAVGYLLEVLRDLGADVQVDVLLLRNPAEHADLNDPGAVAYLLNALRKAGADTQLATLADKAAEHTPLTDPRAVAELLEELQEIGAKTEIATLLSRNPAEHTVLGDPGAVADLLEALQKTGADTHVAMLLSRNPAERTHLDDPYRVIRLINALQLSKADGQVAALIERLPNAGMFDRFMEIGNHHEIFRFGREPDASAATLWTWDDLG
ncbi:helix-turn-helix domain-containing protein [Nocardia nepalensis]|uniref:helix-turn-helix domain-containing protein n=1 Tax=Nocardia nepalensis TaxID=3375448 RepID=UPI003B671361